MNIYKDDSLEIDYGYFKCKGCGNEFFGNGKALHRQDCPERLKLNAYENCDYYVGPKCAEYGTAFVKEKKS